MTAVADATALIYLLRLGEEQLLDVVFDRLLVPDAVVTELAHDRDELNRLSAVPAVSFDGMDTATLSPLDDAYAHLHAGETAALQLALHYSTRFVIVDDLAAREAAAALGLRPVGLLGILIECKATGTITAARADRAIAAGYYVSAALYARFRMIVGE